jgi:tRNA A37 threonylcarbamoyladenosine synthetase subunit TsaC/SUA5/YrdC
MRFNFTRTLSRLVGNAVVHPSSNKSTKPSSTNSYLLNKAIRTVRHHHFRLW